MEVAGRPGTDRGCQPVCSLAAMMPASLITPITGGSGGGGTGRLVRMVAGENECLGDVIHEIVAPSLGHVSGVSCPIIAATSKG